MTIIGDIVRCREIHRDRMNVLKVVLLGYLIASTNPTYDLLQEMDGIPSKSKQYLPSSVDSISSGYHLF